jgi:ubiquitin carboxyl-terminal hydrolase 25/28
MQPHPDDPAPPAEPLASNNPFRPPAALIPDLLVGGLPFKSLNRILNDVRWTAAWRALGATTSLLNSKPADYAAALAALASRDPAARLDAHILNNVLRYAPSCETTALEGRQRTVLRAVLARPAELYHLQIAVLETAAAATPHDQREYHLVPRILIPPAVHRLFGDDAPSDPLDEAFFKATNTKNDHTIRVLIFPAEFTASDLVPLTDARLIRQRYLAAAQRYPHAHLPPHAVPTAANCFSTLLKVLRGPVLLAPGEQTKTINRDNPLLNLQIDVLLMLERLGFSERDGELVPPNLVEGGRETYVRRILEVIYRGHKLPAGAAPAASEASPLSASARVPAQPVASQSSAGASSQAPPAAAAPQAAAPQAAAPQATAPQATASAPAFGGGPGNEFATAVSFSNNLSLVFRTFAEVNHHLSASFGNNDVDNQLAFLISLSCCVFYPDESVIRCFENTVRGDRAHRLRYVDDLRELIQYRAASAPGGARTKLSNYYASNRLVGLHEYTAALGALGFGSGSAAHDADDDTVIAVYLASVKLDPKNYPYFNQKLQLVSQARQSLRLARFVAEEVLPQPVALDALNIEEITEDEVVVTAYEFRRDDAAQSDEVAFVDRALLLVAVHRRSYSLMSYVEAKLPHLAHTAVGQSLSLAQAYELLGCTAQANEFEVILAFQQRVVEPAHDVRTLRAALRAVIESRKLGSRLLVLFLATGQIDVALLPAQNWPAGLDNIGNTCYLNSLLQYYFCVKPLRETVLAFEAQDAFEPRKIGGRTVERAEVVRANQFVYHLKRLFRDMIESDKRCVQPSKELAFLAFLPASQPVTFAAAGDDDTPDAGDADTTPDAGDADTTPDAGDADTTPDAGDADISPVVVASRTPSDMEVDTDSIEIIEEPADAVPAGDRLEVAAVDDPIEVAVADDPTEVAVADDPIETVPSVDAADAAAASASVLPIDPTIMDSTIEMGRQQDVTECIENVTFQLEAALRPQSIEDDGEQYDLIKQLYYGKTKQKITPLNGGVERTLVERFSSLIINVSDHPRDIYDALDSYFSEDVVELEEGAAKKSLTICELPQILQFHVQRVLFDRERLMPYKSLEPIPFGERIYLDRYLDTDDAEMLRKREEVFQWKREIGEALQRRQRLLHKPDGHMTVVDSLVTARRLLELRGAERHAAAIAAIAAEVQRRHQELAALDAALQRLHECVAAQFAAYTRVAYLIFAIFIHRGEASYGHYWIYIRDPQRNIFRKYNDEVVTEVPLSEVMNFAEGNTATPYYIVYAKELLEAEYIEPLKRKIRQP